MPDSADFKRPSDADMRARVVQRQLWFWSGSLAGAMIFAVAMFFVARHAS